MNKKLLAIPALAGLLFTVPMLAHHSFSAEFDSNKPVTLDGRVVKMEWSNPHTWLYIDITGKDGKTERWAVEGGAPGVLLRNGFKRDSFPEGTHVIVTGFASKDGALRANSRSITFPDSGGKSIDTGSSFGDGKGK